MDVRRTTKRPHSVKKGTDKNAKRRYIYQHMTPAEKQILLSERRIKQRESTSRRLLQNIAPDRFTQPNSSTETFDTVGSTSQSTTPSSLGGTATARSSGFFEIDCAPTSASVMQVATSSQLFPTVGSTSQSIMPSLLGRTATVHSLSTFERGSTSGTSHQECTLTSEPIRRNGRVRARGITTNISERRSDYVQLKKVANCKFCCATKFQYESPGFCCAKVQLSYAHIKCQISCDIYIQQDFTWTNNFCLTNSLHGISSYYIDMCHSWSLRTRLTKLPLRPIRNTD